MAQKKQMLSSTRSEWVRQEGQAATQTLYRTTRSRANKEINKSTYIIIYLDVAKKVIYLEVTISMKIGMGVLENDVCLRHVYV